MTWTKVTDGPVLRDVPDHLANPSDFRDGYDYKNPPTLADMIVVGLLFGYPLGPTAGMFFFPPGPPG